MLDDHKVAFITCVNDEAEYAECRYYLDRLQIPAGYTVEIMSIREATSMTAGYQAAMKDSDAKYKIYLHQDVFIINRRFIEEMLAVFIRDEKIGMLGVIGKKEIKESMERVGLDPGSKKKVGKYSLGMRQRLGIAQAIMENPDILILDESMNGLDNQGVEDVREILLKYKG